MNKKYDAKTGMTIKIAFYLYLCVMIGIHAIYILIIHLLQIIMHVLTSITMHISAFIKKYP